MSWTHSICWECWERENPGRSPIQLKEREIELCCFCGGKTDAAIYVREDPKDLRCQGKHEEG